MTGAYDSGLEKVKGRAGWGCHLILNVLADESKPLKRTEGLEIVLQGTGVDLARFSRLPGALVRYSGDIEAAV